MDFNITVIKGVVTAQWTVDDLVVLYIDIAMVISRIKADVDAAGADVVDVERVAAQVEIAGHATVLACTMVSEKGDDHITQWLFFLVFLIPSIVELVVLNKNVGTIDLAANVFLGMVHQSIKNGYGLVFTVFDNLIALDVDVMHLASQPQATAIVAVVVVGDVAVGDVDIGAHLQVKVGETGVVVVAFYMMDVHAVAVADFKQVIALLIPPDALMFLYTERDIANT